MRGWERQAARHYVHKGPDHWTCSTMGGLCHGCLRCYWRDLTGQTRRARKRHIAKMRELRDRAPIVPVQRWQP